MLEGILKLVVKDLVVGVEVLSSVYFGVYFTFPDILGALNIL